MRADEPGARGRRAFAGRAAEGAAYRFLPEREKAAREEGGVVENAATLIVREPQRSG